MYSYYSMTKTELPFFLHKQAWSNALVKLRTDIDLINLINVT